MEPGIKPTGAIPPPGRRVRCAKCGHVWYQPAPAPEGEPEPISPKPEPPPAACGAAPQPAGRTAGYARRRAAERQAPSPRRRGRAPCHGGRLDRARSPSSCSSAIRRCVYRQESRPSGRNRLALFRARAQDQSARHRFHDVTYRREDRRRPERRWSVTGKIVNSAARELPVPQTSRVARATTASVNCTIGPSRRASAPARQATFSHPAFQPARGRAASRSALCPERRVKDACHRILYPESLIAARVDNWPRIARLRSGPRSRCRFSSAASSSPRIWCARWRAKAFRSRPRFSGSEAMATRGEQGVSVIAGLRADPRQACAGGRRRARLRPHVAKAV